MNTQFLIEKKENGKALLVESSYKSKYPSIALLKFSTYLKNRGYKVDYVKGVKEFQNKYDVILITTLFTFNWIESINTIRHYVNNFHKSKISVGGVYASLMPEHIYQNSGIKPCMGCIEEVDECVPDYNLLPRSYYKETSRIFTSKGCPRECQFCGTKVLEPKMRIIKNWKHHFLPEGSFSIIHDNNILAHGDDHFIDVVNFLRENRFKFIFDNGFDCRLFDKGHAKALRYAPINEIRFSYDTMEQEGYIQNAIRSCIQYGIHPKKIKVFVLYNFRDNIENALYRAREVHRLGVRVWAMRYNPLDWLYPHIPYICETWELEDLFYFNSYINRFGIIKKYTYEEWKKKKIADTERYLASRKWDIENIITKGLESARKKRDKETLFSDPNFIKSLIKGERDLSNK